MAAVAPCAGAWVEIFIKSAGAGAIRSPPVRGRGLKSLAQLVPVVGHVAPCAGAWVEIVEHFGRPLCYKWSPPVRGRGLKYKIINSHTAVRGVAPCAGAWVEMTSGTMTESSSRSRPLCGGVG